jgi:hypothetical protein
MDAEASEHDLKTKCRAAMRCSAVTLDQFDHRNARTEEVTGIDETLETVEAQLLAPRLEQSTDWRHTCCMKGLRWSTG